MNDTPLCIQVSLISQDDPEYIAEMIQLLVDDLRELDDVESIKPVSAELPAGAKGVGIDFSAILVNVAQAGGFTALAATLTAWVSGRHNRTLKLSVNNSTIEVNGLSSSQQIDLIDWFKTQASKPA